MRIFNIKVRLTDFFIFFEYNYRWEDNMNIGYYAGDQHFLSHALVLYKSIKASLKTSKQTLVVKTRDFDFFYKHLPKDILIMTIDDESKLPFLDKIHAASLFESQVHSTFLWLDIDSYILKAFDVSSHDIMINPVDMKNIGLAYEAQISPLWQYISKKLSLDLSEFKSLTTGISNEIIYPYFNIGFISSHSKHELFKKTYHFILHALSDDELILDTPLKQIFFHQAVFTCFVLKHIPEDKILRLPRGLNYPLHLKNKDEAFDFNQLISFRYDTFFNHAVDLKLPNDLEENKEKLTMKWTY